MKFYTLLAVLALSSILNTVYASDNTITEDENYSYCAEQAQREDVVDENEKARYIKDCVESYRTSSLESEKEIEKLINN